MNIPQLVLSVKQCGKFVSEKYIQAIMFILIYLHIFIFRLHLNACFFLCDIPLHTAPLPVFPGSLPHCFLCSASELISLTSQQLQAVFLIYSLSRYHRTAPVVPSSPSPPQKFLSLLSPWPRGNNPLLQEALQKWCRWFLLQAPHAFPSTTLWVRCKFSKFSQFH